jgi:hypothetical protein
MGCPKPIDPVSGYERVETASFLGAEARRARSTPATLGHRRGSVTVYPPSV